MPTKKKPTRGRNCGYNAGYQRHIRRGERPCGECRQAHADWVYAHRHGLEKLRAPRRRSARMIRAEMIRKAELFVGLSDQEYEAVMAESENS